MVISYPPQTGQVIEVKLPVTPVKGGEKWYFLSKIVDKLETRETKKTLVSNGITPAKKAIVFLNIIILTMFFELDISYAVSEVNKRCKLSLRIKNQVKLRLVYNFTSKFESEQFLNFVFSILNVNISLDLNFRRRDFENKPCKWNYSTKGFFLGINIVMPTFIQQTFTKA